jgi:hypothetical protein
MSDDRLKQVFRSFPGRIYGVNVPRQPLQRKESDKSLPKSAQETYLESPPSWAFATARPATAMKRFLTATMIPRLYFIDVDQTAIAFNKPLTILISPPIHADNPQSTHRLTAPATAPSTGIRKPKAKPHSASAIGHASTSSRALGRFTPIIVP